MRVLFIIILIDIIIFSIGVIFVEDESMVDTNQSKEYHVDRYGYYWSVD